MDRDFKIWIINILPLSLFNLFNISNSDGFISNELLNLSIFGCGYNANFGFGLTKRDDIISFFLVVVLKFLRTAYPNRSLPLISVVSPLNGVFFISLIMRAGFSLLPRIPLASLLSGIIVLVAHACIPRKSLLTIIYIIC